MSVTRAGREEEIDPEKVACYSFWKKNRQCKNCISARVLREKNQGTKLEFAGEDIYQVTACYMEIDGKAYVMELVKKLNEEFLLDAEGCEKLVRKLDGYNQQRNGLPSRLGVCWRSKGKTRN